MGILLELASLLVAFVSAVISVASAYTAWRAVRPRPKLRGNITSTWHIGAEFPNRNHGLIVLMHVVFTNASAYPIHLVGYKLEVKIGNNWKSADRLQNWGKVEIPPIYLNAGKLVARLKPEDHLIDWPPKPVDHGSPLMGFQGFMLVGQVQPESIQDYRLTAVDAFKNHWKVSLSASEAEAWKANSGHFTLPELYRHAGVPVERVSTSD